MASRKFIIDIPSQKIEVWAESKESAGDQFDITDLQYDVYQESPRVSIPAQGGDVNYYIDRLLMYDENDYCEGYIGTGDRVFFTDGFRLIAAKRGAVDISGYREWKMEEKKRSNVTKLISDAAWEESQTVIKLDIADVIKKADEKLKKCENPVYVINAGGIIHAANAIYILEALCVTGASSFRVGNDPVAPWLFGEEGGDVNAVVLPIDCKYKKKLEYDLVIE